MTFAVAEIEGHTLPPSWNIAPTQETYIVDEDPEGVRRLRTVRWGLVPSWAHDLSGAARLINARAETVADKPSFRAAFAKRRCLVPMDGWYEWSGAAKQPWFLSPVDGMAAVAGIYEMWRPANAAVGDPSTVVHTMSIITTEPSADIAHVHDRMPVLLPAAAFERWLDPEAPLAEARALLRPAPEGTVRAWKVSRAVSTVRNNDPSLVEPIAQEAAPEAPAAEQPGLFD